MCDMLDLALANLLSPIVLSFILGLSAALVRSDLSVPEAVAKGISIYLLFAIGFKGGASLAEHGIDGTLALSLTAGVVLSFGLPLVGFAVLRALSGISRTDAAAVAGHYGSISIVTFVAGTSVLADAGITSEGYMVAVAAAMEAPAILSALWLISRGSDATDMSADVWREILLNGSIVLLLGAFAIGIATGADGLAQIESFIVSPFQGVLCLFLLDMGLIAGRGLRQASVLDKGAIAFGVIMPVVGASTGLMAALLVGLSLGGTVLMMTLAASASYIAVPAAMRVAVPQANPSIYLTLSLAITFPFNLIVGLPLYLTVAQNILGS
ncbi:MAG: sodium-dependent bicarbonate transport family permease [Pseudomonadota bacterium]